jgi:hypothetical protein
MKTFRKSFFILTYCLLLISSPKAQAWSDGSGWANYAYLIKIYLENVKRFHQLNMMIDRQNKHDQYIRILNDGLNNATGLISVLPIKDEQILSQLRDFQTALKKVEEIYGLIPKSSNAELHRLHDQTIAESFKMSTTLKDYAERQELNATNIFIQSASASPKGAERMNAQTSAQILHSVNQLIKVNGQLLKLQSESFALTNKGGKDSTEGFNKAKNDLERAMRKMKPQFDFPKF